MFPPALLPVGQLMPLAWLLPEYVLSAGLDGHVIVFLFTVALYVALAAAYCAVCDVVTVIVAVLLSDVFAFGVIVNVVPLILHVATVSSLLEHDNVPFPVFVIVLVPFVPYVNVPLVGSKLTLAAALVTAALNVFVAALAQLSVSVGVYPTVIFVPVVYATPL